jgi:predicted permease
MLMATAGMFVRTLRNLHNVDLGFEPENIALFDIDPTTLGYQGQRLRNFYDQLVEDARRVHGVRSAALSGEAPMTLHCRVGLVTAAKSEPLPGKDSALLNPVSSGYFTTLGIPLLLGRDFQPEDEPKVTPYNSSLFGLSRSSGGGGPGIDASRVCIIDEGEARHLFGTANPVGRLLWHGDQALEIIGVVKNVHGESITRPDEFGIVYEPNWSNGAEVRWLLVRFAGKPDAVIPGIRRVLQDLDPNVALMRVRTMEEYVNSLLTSERMIAYLSSLFGVLALGLASVGLYGVLAYAVTRRTREIGIRRALGAQRRDVVGMILRESFLPVLVGVVIGSAAAFFWTIFLGSLLYGIDSFDPESISVAVMVMLTAALLAAAIPARRAIKVDPMVALRYE